MSGDTDRVGRTALHYAALSNDVEQTQRLLAEGADVDAADKQGFTPLHLGAQQWSVEASQILLDSGAEVDAVNVFGNTPLFVAVFNSRGRGDLITLLRNHGADPMLTNASGQSPAGLAQLIGNYDVKQYFSDLTYGS